MNDPILCPECGLEMTPAFGPFEIGTPIDEVERRMGGKPDRWLCPECRHSEGES